MKKKIGNLEYESFDLFDEKGCLKMIKNPKIDLDEMARRIPSLEETIEKWNSMNKSK